MSWIDLPSGRIEVDDIPAPVGEAADPLVLLHEGLGSVRLWKDFPARLGRATGRRVVSYSRYGYGTSATVALPRPVGYMHEEADRVLPLVLDRMGIDRPVLVGHSDGASIALLYAGRRRPVSAIVAMAPHAFVEDCTVRGALAARAAYQDGPLRGRLARYHDDVDTAFYGWNDIWLDPAFRGWSIEDRLPAVSAPVLLVQCRDDPYGTMEQLDRIEAAVRGPVERLVMDEGGHAPHAADPDRVLSAIAGFIGLSPCAGPRRP